MMCPCGEEGVIFALIHLSNSICGRGCLRTSGGSDKEEEERVELG